jgi:hypothetical protein
VPLPTVPDFSHRPPMPIRPHLDGHKFDSETIRVMGLHLKWPWSHFGLLIAATSPTKCRHGGSWILQRPASAIPSDCARGCCTSFAGRRRRCDGRAGCDGEISPERAEPGRCQPSFGDASFWAAHLVPHRLGCPIEQLAACTPAPCKENADLFRLQSDALTDLRVLIRVTKCQSGGSAFVP